MLKRIPLHRKAFAVHPALRASENRSKEVRDLIREMSRANPTWGSPRIVGELRKLGIEVAKSTVEKYRLRPRKPSSPTWKAFLKNHVKDLIAMDSFVVPTVTYKILFILVILAHERRRVVRFNITEHPTALWTMQQLRDAIPADHGYRFLMHDRDAIFSQELDQRIRHLGLRVLKTPPQSPQANALCERLLGTRRRECLDFLIPRTEHHLRRLLHEWVPHYNQGRPHTALGPGIPQPPPPLPTLLQAHRHRLPAHLRVVAHPILGGLHHAYRRDEQAA